MNKQNENINSTLILILRCSRMYRQQRNDGYAMLLVSVLAILIFSLLSVYLFSTNLYRSSANAIVDSSSTFYAAEAGMNKRAALAHGKFLGFSQPTGMPPVGTSPAEKMQSCFSNNTSVQGTEDFACTADNFDYYEHVDSGTGVISASRKNAKNGNNSKYIAYTFIQQNPRNLANYPETKKVPAGEPFAGLNSLEYSYRVYAAAVKKNTSNDPNTELSAQTLLQLDFNSRVLPLFQFAAFYEKDLEINPSPNMSLNGPVHTNSKLFMAPGRDLLIQGQVTSFGNMYNSLNVVATHDKGIDPRIRIKTGPNPTDYLDISTLIAWTQANHQIDAADISLSNGFLRPGVAKLEIPDPGFLSKTDTAGNMGEYYGKADLQVDFTPNTDPAQIPFRIAVIKTGQGSTPSCVGFDIAASRQSTGGISCENLSMGSLRSLRQPVLVVPAAPNIAAEQAVFCGAAVTPGPLTTSLSAIQKEQVANALAAAIAAQPVPISYSALSQTMNNTAPNSLLATFTNYLNLVGISGADQTAILAAKPTEIAAMSGRCFLPAPLQVVTVNDRREGRNIQVLQTNIKSVVAWNRDGRTVTLNLDGSVNNSFGGQGENIPQRLYRTAPADSSAPAQSYRNLGLSASDRTEGGLVWHFNINKVVYSYTLQQSVYGFGFSGGSNLPGPLTIATDQAIYLQGDYNSVDPRPAATMGDTLAVLSNACTNADFKISCGDLTPTSDLPIATVTTVNAAFLSRTDETDTAATPVRYSGGLNNYIRMLENWQNITLNYTGSFISLGTPREFSGRYQPGKLGWGNLLDITNLNDYYYYYPPIRNFAYDTNFNFADRLPPLTPKVVYLKQKVFKRDYGSLNG